MINISQESPQDLESIYNLNLKAFESDAEAKLVDKLRETIKPFISLVAKEHGIVLGHILFTPVCVGDSNVSAMGSMVYLNGGDDLSVPLSRVEAAGGKVLLDKMSIGEYGFIAYFLDSEGNKVALHSMS